MMKCIRQCLEAPDEKVVEGNKVRFQKEFHFDIGLLQYSRQLSCKVRVICVKTKNGYLVVTAYPI